MNKRKVVPKRKAAKKRKAVDFINASDEHKGKKEQKKDARKAGLPVTDQKSAKKALLEGVKAQPPKPAKTNSSPKNKQ